MNQKYIILINEKHTRMLSNYYYISSLAILNKNTMY